MKVALVNHGCAKNLVDSELMLGLLEKKGYEVTLDDNEADIVVINTCSFIHDAEKESVQSILQTAQNGKKVIVAGCLPQKYKGELKKALPEIAGMVGTSDIKEIVNVVEKVAEGKKNIDKISPKPRYIYPETIERLQITVGPSSYIKIADGCNYHCGYCIIPQLRGEYHSRTIENIVAEAKSLLAKGVTELILIAQDTTSYGIDLYGKKSLTRLLEELNKLQGDFWIRIMYTYPSQMTDDLLDTIARLDKVVKYIDLPLQHFNKEILEAMRRPVLDYDKLITKIRTKIPNVAIRTAFITGYPGETEEQFNELYDFVKRTKFEKMGVFEYSREKNTVSYDMSNQVPDKIKRQRRKKLMTLQQKISADINKRYVGKILRCIIEGFTDDGLVILRTQHDAPETDGMVYASSEKEVIPGDFEDVLIENSDEYDLYGRIT